MNKEEAIKQLKKHKQEIDKQYISSRYSKAIEIVLNLIKKQDKIIDKMAEHLADIIENDDNASLLPFSDSEDNLEEKVKEYFKKVVDEDVKD